MAENHRSQDEEQGDGAVRSVFGACWDELRETIGTAPTAVLLKRAVAMSHEACPLLEKIKIEKDDRDYKYNVPLDVDTDPEACNNIGLFVQNILTLLQKLTGDVLVDQLLSNPLIRKLASKE